MRIDPSISPPLPETQPSGPTSPRTPRSGPPPATRAAASTSDALRRPMPAQEMQRPAPVPASRQAEEEATGMEMRVEERLNQILSDVMSPNARLRVHRDEGSERFVYQSVDRLTGEILTQFPPDELLRVIAAIRRAEGLIFDTDA